ncbi:MAG: tetratricopeptide repeat protein [Pseudomonadota bacterium]
MIRSLAFALVLVPVAAAADFPETSAPDLVLLKTWIEEGQPQAAVDVLKVELAEAPSADILNLLGYAHRKLQNWEAARGYYERALALNPRHTGALEYFGELELETGNPEAARRLHARLADACPDGCEELDDLNEAFATHGVAHP